MIEQKMDIRMVDLKTQYEKIKPEIDGIIQNVIDDTSFIKGKYVQSFTENLSRYLGVKHVIPCGNGTDALQLALMAMDFEPGTEIITTPFTFVATVEVICLLGLTPVFVDICEDTFNLDPDLLEAAISEKTGAIIPVHLFGQAADMTSIMAVADKYGLKVIEDTAQAISATYDIEGQSVNLGSIGDVGTFSFFPSKNLGCYGDGGAVCTNDAELARKINLLANHGSSKKYYYESIGINSRLDGIQAGILDVKLRYLDSYVEQRIAAADRYDKLLSEVEEIILPVRKKNRNHVFHQYTIQVNENRDVIQTHLKSNGIPSAIYYPSALHKQTIYGKYHMDRPELKVTEKLCQSVLSLPMHTELDWEMQHHIADHLKAAISASR